LGGFDKKSNEIICLNQSMPALTLTGRRLGASVTAAILAAVLALPAQAEELKKVRFAYLLSDTLLSVFRAKDQGYFAAEGLDVDLIPVQGGPAVAAAGQPYDESRVVVLPFPQQEAALEQGTIDVGCAIQPFDASIEANPEIGAKVIVRGLLADEKEPVISDSVIGTDA